jgi:RNA polymerase sigma factor (sigma-70 family)
VNERRRETPKLEAEDRAAHGSPHAAATADPCEKADAFNQYRRLLLSIAYRMVGSMAEAEDLVQDSYIRWQQTSTPVGSPRAFLVTTVSRLCINHLQSARVRREVYVGSWLPEPVIADEPFEHPGASDESISIAFLLLLERLAPAERAVFLLREVFEYEYGEIAGILNQSDLSRLQRREAVSDRRDGAGDRDPVSRPSHARRRGAPRVGVLRRGDCGAPRRSSADQQRADRRLQLPPPLPGHAASRDRPLVRVGWHMAPSSGAVSSGTDRR